MVSYLQNIPELKLFTIPKIIKCRPFICSFKNGRLSILPYKMMVDIGRRTFGSTKKNNILVPNFISYFIYLKILINFLYARQPFTTIYFKSSAY